MSSSYVTLEQVAQHAGVSLATASRVINGSTRQVSQRLSEKVNASAEELGYLANASAQTLARNSSSLVGLLVHDIADPYFSSIARGVTRYTEEQGLVTVLGTTYRSAQKESMILAALRAHRAKAVVLVGSRSTDEESNARLVREIEAFQQQGGRVACVSQPGLPADTVSPDNHTGAAELARHLIALGHRRFAILAGPTNLSTARERLDGFHSALSAAGLELEHHNIVHGDFTRDGGFESTQRLMRLGTDATCLFAVNDVMATGAMAALRESGIGVPEELSVAGFDDIPTLRDLAPALTTVRLPLEQMGERAAQMALESDHEGEDRTVNVQGEVLMRESTGKPPTR